MGEIEILDLYIFRSEGNDDPLPESFVTRRIEGNEITNRKFSIKNVEHVKIYHTGG
jgi:hypothetical protein